MSQNTTAAPSDSIEPTPLPKSKKNKGKKGKKMKKKKKSKEGLESLSPSPSPANATTVAPIGLVTMEPIATNAPVAVMVPPVAVVPTVIPGNGTVTFTPTVQSKSKKMKKSKKGGKGKGAKEASFQLAGSQATKSPALLNPVPATVRSKTTTSTSEAPTSSYAVNSKVTSKAPTINAALMTTKVPNIKNTATTSKAPVASDPKNLTKVEFDDTIATPFPSSPSSSQSPSPFPSPSVTNELLSASPAPSMLLETVDVSPFQLTYNIDTNDKLSTEQIAAAVDASFVFLNDYLMDAFDVNNRISYDSLLGSRIAHSVDYTTVQYMAAARFIVADSDATTYLPVTSDIDALIERAFNPRSIETLLDMLRNLPADNPYTQTNAVVYSSITVESPATVIDQQPNMASGKTVATRVGISGAVLVICVCTGLVALYRWGFFKKIRRKRNEKSYHKAPTASRSCSTQKGKNPKVENRDNVNDGDEEDDDDASMSDCTSSVRSCPPSASCNSSSVDKDETYRSRILEDDVEINFLYPKTDGNMNCDTSINDPLFPSSPLISQEGDYAKKRHNI